MTDRYNALLITLEKDLRADDAESLMEAIRHLRGVLDVRGNIVQPSDYIAEQRAKAEIREKLFVSLS